MKKDAKPGQLVTFRVGEYELSLPVEDVQSIVPVFHSEIINYSGDAKNVVGLMVIEGNTVPVISLRQKFGLKAESLAGCNARIVEIESKGKPVGLLVDGAIGVIDGENGDPEASFSPPIDSEFISSYSINSGDGDEFTLPILDSTTIVDHDSLAGLFK